MQGVRKKKVPYIMPFFMVKDFFTLPPSVAMNRVELNSNFRLICLSGLEQNLSGLEQLPDLG